MPSRIYNLTIDARDPLELARFWRQVLDYDTSYEQPEEVAIEPRGHDDPPALVFVPLPRVRRSRSGSASIGRRTIRRRKSPAWTAWARTASISARARCRGS